jgi:beta-lactamase superfamily II metal-dependent hydrolase
LQVVPESAAGSPKSDESDGLARGVYHFLDMGKLKYGECTIATFGDLRVMIDGGHSRDYAGQQGVPSIPQQLEEIFGEPAPHIISLIVVTHCHDDHVGCLDQLVANNIIQPEWALITHPDLGFGRGDADDGSLSDLQQGIRTKVLTAALREEDASDLNDYQLQNFLDSAGTVEDRYRSFIAELTAKNVKVIEYDGDELPPELVELMMPSGMKLLGPSATQLIACAQQIATTNKEASAAVVEALSKDSTADNVSLYRRIVSEDNELDGRNPRGSGMNCQSITLAFGPKASRVLLAGDMQFREPGVEDAAEEMQGLRKAVADYGPYKLFKTTHHTSHNGQDDEFLRELGYPPIMVHSGGLNDPTHPDPETLRTLKKLAGQIVFARTDRNGRITVRPSKSVDEAVTISRGRINNFADNVRDAEFVAPPAAVSVPPVRSGPSISARETSVSPAVVPPLAPQGIQIVIVNLPPGAADLTVAGVDIKVRIPSAPSGPARLVDTRGALQLAGGRNLPPLLFVTNSERLRANIGDSGAAAVLAAITSPHHVLDVQGPLNQTLRTVRDELKSRQYEGVVILGGYDVVPAVPADVLPADLRQTLPSSSIENEQDEFLVWSDELYTDVDEDSIGELPVSRIPDGRSYELMKAALSSTPPQMSSAFGIRNVARPFADEVWQQAGGRVPKLKVSEVFESDHVVSEEANAPLHYHMLHGEDDNGRRFTGERVSGGGVVAFTVENVPRRFDGVVVSGCCWGALTVAQKASDVDDGEPVAARTASDSIALSYLSAGANAFIGCTGAHYSGPATTSEDNLALDFHQLLLGNLAQKKLPPSRALHEARLDFGTKLAGGRLMEPLALARRLKNRSQFTCLGLGW